MGFWIEDSRFQIARQTGRTRDLRDCGAIYNLKSSIYNRLYSYRSASTGSSFDARSAGTSPLITPTTNNTAVESSTVNSEIRR
jgi:hypothetical protein